MSDEIIGTDAFTALQRRAILALADMIIPASADGRKPSAAAVDVLGYIRAHAQYAMANLRAELDALETRARAAHGAGFLDLPPASRVALVDSARDETPGFLRDLALLTATAYYQDDQVLVALGMEARPPFPKGYEVPAGDLSLLEPVRARGRIYREAPP